MIKNIIFDLGNIIVNNPSIDIVKMFFKDEEDVKIFNDYIFKSNYWEMMDLGKMTNLEIAQKIEKDKPIKLKDYQAVYDFMSEWYTKRKLNDDTIELAFKLKEKGYHLFILSNMSKPTYEYIAKLNDFFSMVDGTIVSAYVGVKKPDKKIFDILLKKYSLNPEECVLIDDDDTNKTFETAHSIGIKGRRVQPNSVEDIVNMLKENGIELLENQ